jgi:radical SAM protein with 4Fe4S-binding SPASM domain
MKHPYDSENDTLQSLGSSYMDFMALRLADYFRKNPGCADCEFHNRCAGGCRGQAVEYSDTADVLAKDPEVCTFYKKGWYQKTLAMIKELGKAKEEKSLQINSQADFEEL